MYIRKAPDVPQLIFPILIPHLLADLVKLLAKLDFADEDFSP